VWRRADPVDVHAVTLTLVADTHGEGPQGVAEAIRHALEHHLPYGSPRVPVVTIDGVDPSCCVHSLDRHKLTGRLYGWCYDCGRRCPEEVFSVRAEAEGR
jgi:hypothetical protein